MSDNKDELVVISNIKEAVNLFQEYGIYVEFMDAKNKNEYEELFKKSQLAIVNDTIYNLFETFEGFVFLRSDKRKTDFVFKNTVLLTSDLFNNSMRILAQMMLRHIQEKKEKNNLFKFLTEAMNKYEKEQKIVDELKYKETAIISILNHELKTPLGIISGNIELIQNTNLSEIQKDYVKKIARGNKRLKENIDEILLFENLDINKTDNLGFVAFQDIIDELILDYEEIASEKNISIETEIDEKLASKFIGDNRKLSIVIKQLFSNAIKFTDEGKITIKISVKEDEEDYQIIELIIKDTGIGFEENKLSEYLKPFYQEEYYLIRKNEGLGLGLSIVNNLLNKMDAKLTVKSELKNGSIFTVELKLDRADILNRIQFKNIKILQVEDVFLNRVITRQILEKRGVIIDDAADGNEAIELVKKNQYDLILMDNIMPNMDGLTASSLISKIDKTVPIILLTASKNRVNLEEMTKAGIVDILEKNHTADCYVRIIKKHIGLDKWFLTEVEVAKSNIDVKNKAIKQYKSLDIDSVYARFSGNEMLIEKLAKGYIEETKEIENYWIEYINYNYENAIRFFHSLKGMQKSLSANSVAELTEEIENKEIDMSKQDDFYRVYLFSIKEVNIELHELIEDIKNKQKPKEKIRKALIEITDTKLGDILMELSQQIKKRSIRNIKDCIKTLDSYYSINYEIQISQIKENIEKYDYNKAINQIEDLFKYLNK